MARLQREHTLSRTNTPPLAFRLQLVRSHKKAYSKHAEDLDVLIYDIQDVGSRTYTYISTLRLAMEAAKECGKTVIVLDRPNPVGCEIGSART